MEGQEGPAKQGSPTSPTPKSALNAPEPPRHGNKARHTEPGSGPAPGSRRPGAVPPLAATQRQEHQATQTQTKPFVTPAALQTEADVTARVSAFLLFQGILHIQMSKMKPISPPLARATVSLTLTSEHNSLTISSRSMTRIRAKTPNMNN